MFFVFVGFFLLILFFDMKLDVELYESFYFRRNEQINVAVWSQSQLQFLCRAVITVVGILQLGSCSFTSFIIHVRIRYTQDDRTSHRSYWWNSSAPYFFNDYNYMLYRTQVTSVRSLCAQISMNTSALRMSTFTRRVRHRYGYI